MPGIKVKGMSCEHCVASVAKAVGQVENVERVEVNLEKGEAVFTASGPVDLAKVREAVAGIGFEPGEEV